MVEHKQQKVIVDVDMGCDDAVALLACMKDQNTDILAITAVAGNTNVDQVLSNIGTILKYMDSEIPFFKGAEQGIISPAVAEGYPGHGKDGLGDSELFDRSNIPKVSEGHGALKIIEIVKAHPGEIELLCLGPLTNLALAIRLEPSLVSLIKRVFIMGGTHSALGNDSSAAEFNFYSDPEGAAIVFDSFADSEQVKLQMISWELTLKHVFTWEFYDKLVGRTGVEATKAGFCMREACLALEKELRPEDQQTGQPRVFIPCDFYAAAAMIDNSLIKESKTKHVSIELQGSLTRGMSVIDWYGKHNQGKVNCQIITELDQEGLEKLMERTFSN